MTADPLPVPEPEWLSGIYIASKAHHFRRWQELRASGVPIISTWMSVHCIVTSPPYYGLRDYGRLEGVPRSSAGLPIVCVGPRRL
jgi:hypothetical protein